MKCTACDQPVFEGALCQRHSIAAKNLKAQHSVWVKAFGELSWEVYLKRVISNKNSGSWVLDVAKTNPPSYTTTK